MGCQGWVARMRAGLVSYLGAVLDAALEDFCNSLWGAVAALQLRQSHIEGLLAREHPNCML